MGELLVNLSNHQQFTKLKASKLVVTINILRADLFIHQTFFAKIFIHPLSLNTIVTKFSCYTVHVYIHTYIQHEGVGRGFQTYLETPKLLVLEQKSLHGTATLLLFLVNRRHNVILLVRQKCLTY